MPLLPFALVQLDRLVENRIADAELADIVQQGSALQPASVHQIHSHLFSHQIGEEGDALAMARVGYGPS